MIPAADGRFAPAAADGLLHIVQTHAVPRLVLGGAGQLAVRKENVLRHPVAHREQQLPIGFVHPEMHLGLVALGSGFDGVVHQVGDHRHQLDPPQRDLTQVGEVEIDHDPLPGGLLVFFAEQRVQQRVVAVEDGGRCLHRLGDGVQIRDRAFGIPLLQQQVEGVEVVGKLVGQPPLGRVGVHQGFGLLLLQRRPKLQVPPLDDLPVDHIHADQMHQHSHGQTQREQNIHLDGGDGIVRDHQHDVDEHHHTGEKRRHQHLQRLESLPLSPSADVISRHRPDHKVADRHADDTERSLPDLGRFHVFPQCQQIEQGILAQQADHAVDEAGHQLLAPRSAKAEGEQYQIDDVCKHCGQTEKLHMSEDRAGKSCQRQQTDPEIRAAKPAFAEVEAIHHQKAVPLAQADQMPQQKHRCLMHRRTAPSTRGTLPGSRRIRCG